MTYTYNIYNDKGELIKQVQADSVRFEEGFLLITSRNDGIKAVVSSRFLVMKV